MVLWYNILDVAKLNAYISFTAQHSGYMGGVSSARRLFIKEQRSRHVRYEVTHEWHTKTPQVLYIIDAVGNYGLGWHSDTKEHQSQREKKSFKRLKLVDGVHNAPGLCARSTNTVIICDTCKS